MNINDKLSRVLGSKVMFIIAGLLAASVLYFSYVFGYIQSPGQLLIKDLAVFFVIIGTFVIITGLFFYNIIQMFFLNKPRENEEAAGLETQMVINQPALQKPIIRGLEVFASASIWLVFLYFFQTFFSAVVWILGGRLVYDRLFLPSIIEGTENMLFLIFVFALAMFLVMLTWANWNYWRFGRLDRRKPRPPISNSIIASYYAIPEKMVVSARDMKVARINPLDSGGLNVEIVKELVKN
ncbi:MAG: poly-beta-1,6-N-acetyl-D-glucosamine biosynthesis protein PgaD [Veillonellaceae bacterium]|nr:poly-beta-1,6-N-acetyl-D-glucosamine biosynthesis protein PgaD [Veillonellaceae bacterium]